MCYSFVFDRIVMSNKRKKVMVKFYNTLLYNYIKKFLSYNSKLSTKVLSCSYVANLWEQYVQVELHNIASHLSPSFVSGWLFRYFRSDKQESTWECILIPYPFDLKLVYQTKQYFTNTLTINVCCVITIVNS